MKKKILSIASVALVAVFTTSMAQAVSLDFFAYASGNEHAVEDGTVINFGGLDVTFSAGVGGLGSDFAYFDNGAGLGVCTNLDGPALTGGQCAPSSDDNVTLDEYVTLGFDQLVDFSVTEFLNGSHNAVTDSDTLMIDVNGGGFQQYTFLAALNTVFEDITSISFGYDNIHDLTADQFYLSGAAVSVVPLPAALPLYGAGVALLGFLGMRRRKSEQAHT